MSLKTSPRSDTDGRFLSEKSVKVHHIWTQFGQVDECLSKVNPLIPDAHYCEHRGRLASLQNKLLEDSR